MIESRKERRIDVREQERQEEREKKIECNGRRQAGWGKRPRLPRRPATNCRRPRLRAARYSRRSARGGSGGRLEPQNSVAQNTQPAPEFSARRGILALDPRAFVPRNRHMNSGPVCRPVCEPSAESRRNDEIRPATGGIPAAALTDACTADGNTSMGNETRWKFSG